MRMKKNLIFWLLLVSSLMIIGLSSCDKTESLNIETTLSFDENFKGQRVMTATIEQKIFKNYFDGEIVQLENMLDTYSPEDIYCFAEETDNGVKITANLSFASYTDYANKISQILSGNTGLEETITPAIYFEYADSTFKNGYAIEENFTSLDLLYWLENGILKVFPDAEKIDMEAFFNLKRTTVEIDGEVIETGEKIKASTMESNAFENIRIETILNDDDTLDVRIDYAIGLETVQTLGSKLTSFMKTLTPDGGTQTSLQEGEYKTYTITFTAEDTAQYAAMMNQALNSENTVFDIHDESDESDTMKARKQMTLFLDGAYFLDYSNENTKMTYIVRVSPEYSFESCVSKNQFMSNYEYEYTEEYCSIYIEVSPADEITLSLGFSVNVEQIDVSTVVANEIDITREIAFTLTNDQETIIGESLEEEIKSKINDDITYKKEEKSNKVRYIVTIRGSSADDITSITTAFLDKSDAEGPSSILTGGKTEKKDINKVVYEYSDKISFMNFLSGAKTNNGIYYQFTYPQGFTASFVEAENYEEVVEENNVLSCVTYNKVIDISSTAYRTNYVGIIQRFLCIASFLGMAIIIVLNLGTITRMLKGTSIDAKAEGLFSKKSYAMLSVFMLCAVLFLVSLIRIIFKVY